MQYSIIRNNDFFGPYTLNTMQLYVNDGTILLQGKIVSNIGENLTVRDVLKANNLKYRIKSGNIYSQIQSYGLSLLFPQDSISLQS